jgi:hypothetical protein
VRRRQALAAAVTLLAAAGCAIQTVPHGRFAALTTESVPSLGYQLDGAQRIRDVEAVVLSQHFLWVPTRTEPPTLAEAVADALHRGNGDLLVDVEVDRIFFAIPLFYGQEGWRVRGDVIRARPREAATAPVTEPTSGTSAPSTSPPETWELPPTE